MNVMADGPPAAPRKRSHKMIIIVSLGATVATALMVPHLIDGHIWSLSVPQTQTLTIAVDLILAAFLIRTLTREILRERAQKDALEWRLNDSFRYIGRTNVALEIVLEFSTALMACSSRREAGTVLRRLHDTIAVGVARAVAARPRIVSASALRTATEFDWSRNSRTPPPLISNKQLWSETAERVLDPREVGAVGSIGGNDLVCIFAACIEEDTKCGGELIRTLVDQFQLLYLFSRNFVTRSDL